MSFITAIGTAVPAHRISQEAIADFMVYAMDLPPDEARKLRTIFKASGIRYRHSVLSDYNRTADFEFYPNTERLDPFPSTALRNQKYREHALALSREAVRQCLHKRGHVDVTSITHLITVSCTGLYAPGLDIELVRALGLSSGVHRTGINFMGCYAAFTAMKVAHALCASHVSARVLIVCTEMCSLHFQRAITDDNLLANSLFADGAAALLMESQPPAGVNLRVTGFHNALAPNGTEHMAWNIGDAGFEMKLSSYVPDVIQEGIGTLTHDLLSRFSRSISQISHLAIHPGGKKILTTIEKTLGLTPEQNKHAYHVLENYGNMSSPTVLFVLSTLLNSLSEKNSGESILSFAFGPGLTLESMLAEVINS